MMSIRSSAAVLKTIWGASSKRNATIRTFGRQAGANIAKLLWHKVGYMNQTLAIAEQKFAALDLSSADLHQTQKSCLQHIRSLIWITRPIGRIMTLLRRQWTTHSQIMELPTAAVWLHAHAQSARSLRCLEHCATGSKICEPQKSNIADIRIGGIGNQWFRRQRPKSMTYSSGFPNGSGRGSMEKMR